ncbi:SCP2 sterol-binding domain-containing protein [Halovenus sp. HT40]|uniref:SCP2 sterol-binding domain-containing protein n=1 Tax=Halovenus sp. HT40 TaxID=3126691 RepID=UPI00300E9870
MHIPSKDWIDKLQEKCNDDAQFNRAAEWSDVNVVLEVDDERYWLKLYGGEIIDTMKYEPMSNPLGYDVILSGSVEAWQAVNDAEMPFWKAYSQGKITIDGNLLEANRMHEAIVRMAELMGENLKVEGDA